MDALQVNVEMPEKLLFLLQPARYKVLYGGRDGVKSWSIARALLCLGTQRPLRILCARETQQSIRESVHQLLSEQVKHLHLEEFYRVLDYTIKAPNGTEFIFAGLRNLTVEQIKSFEALDIVWVEEAQGVLRRSWQVLIPTIRKPGSEIWVSFNPELAEDDTYKRWVIAPPPNSKVVMTSYRDNAWLSAESAQEIEYLRKTDPDTFEHVYEGATRSTVDGAIYKAQITRAEAEKRITLVPYDAAHPVQTFWDLGWSDLVCIWFAQSIGFTYRIIDYYENHFQEIDYYLQVLQSRGYTYSQCVLPWDASSKMMQSSIQQVMRTKGFTVRILDRASVIDGIDAVRRMFPQMYFDAEKCADGLQGLRRYQWGPLPQSGQLKREPLHDRASHPADALRTLAMSVKVPEIKGPKKERDWQPPRSYAPFG
jgi:phage terminase large subunit